MNQSYPDSKDWTTSKKIKEAIPQSQLVKPRIIAKSTAG